MSFGTTRIRGSEEGGDLSTGAHGSDIETRKIAAVRAQRYFSEAWFPAHPEILKRIRKNLKEKKYASPEGLIKDLSQDCALYTFCLRQLSQGGILANRGEDVLRRLRSTTLDEFGHMLAVSDAKISTHKIEGLNSYQALRFQQLLISTSAVRVLAERTKLDTQDAFLLAIIRNLGFMLVSWNYPRIYDKALQAHGTSTESLDRALHRTLGYSVTALGSVIASQWGLPATVVQAMQYVLVDPADVQPPPRPKLTPLDKLCSACELAESLAAASDPEHFPQAAKQVDKIKKEINSVLGPDGTAQVQEAINRTWGLYASLVPERFPETFSYERKDPKTFSDHAKTLHSSNDFIRKCPRALQDNFTEVYRYMSKGKASAASLRLLVNTLIPTAGFHAGCIYLVEPEQVRMIPKIMIGDVTKEDFKPVFQYSMGVFFDPLAKAYMSTTPVKGQAIRGDEEVVLYIASAIGGEAGRGVLYLESTEEYYKSGEQDMLTVFRAVHHALLDALSLSHEHHTGVYIVDKKSNKEDERSTKATSVRDGLT